MLKPNLLGRIRDVPYHTNECVMDFFVGVVFNDINLLTALNELD